MEMKYSYKNATPAESPGSWQDDARLNLRVKNMSKSMLVRLTKAIEEAFSESLKG